MPDKKCTIRNSCCCCVCFICCNLFVIIERKSLSSEENEELNQQLFLKQLSVVSWCGDITCASNAAGYVNMALGHDFNDGILGSAGLMSAFITLYRIYPALKK